ncbi:7386_t:CDS:2 [Acaulospora morrowiae]|uniref:7386_t:CDS:1 n=1 Tax=Acaulospora morrowiae TaxID=94023 RepID=A0A9N8VHM7_9GLOM|nr:7386_t:CDS:2 [Acaulospora morrowiae]
MVRYLLPIFNDTPEENSEDFIRDLKRYTIASQINIVPGAGQAGGRAKLDSLYKLYLTVLNNGGLIDINANQFCEKALVVRNNAGGDNTIIEANIIPAEVWDKN